MVLETIAAVPGMVGGALQHLRSLRLLKSDGGWISTLLDEAENERMHLMTFVKIAEPSQLERWLILLAQGGLLQWVLSAVPDLAADRTSRGRLF